jgi:hypothetical protein
MEFFGYGRRNSNQAAVLQSAGPGFFQEVPSESARGTLRYLSVELQVMVS